MRNFVVVAGLVLTSGALYACGQKSKVAAPATEPFVLSSSDDAGADASDDATTDDDAGTPEKPAEKQFLDDSKTEFRLQLEHPSPGGNWKAVVEQNGQVFIRVHRDADGAHPLAETCATKMLAKEDVAKLMATVKKNRFFTLLESYAGTVDGTSHILQVRLDGKEKKVTEGVVEKPKHDKTARDRVHFDAIDSAMVKITGDWQVTDAAPLKCTDEMAAHLDTDVAAPVAVPAEK